MASRKDKAPPLGKADAGRCAAMARIGAAAHFYKDGRAIGGLHNQVDFTAATPRRPIIARDQLQTLALQMAQGGVFSSITDLFGAAGLRRFGWKETHSERVIFFCLASCR